MTTMLAATVTESNRHKIKYPVYVSYKYDGIRCKLLLSPKTGKRVLYSRTDKPIPNLHIRNLVEHSSLPVGIEGELLVGKTFQDTCSAVMSVGWIGDFVFQVIEYQTNTIFSDRLTEMRSIVKHTNKAWLYMTEHTLVHDNDELVLLEQKAAELGYEGIMLHNPYALYKYGRATIVSQELMKLKPFLEADAKIVGFEELIHKDGSPGNTLGALVCISVYKDGHIQKLDKRVSFNIGSGFTEKERKDIWKNRAAILNSIATFKYQEHGTKDKPRLPIFLRFREDNI